MLQKAFKLVSKTSAGRVKSAKTVTPQNLPFMVFLAFTFSYRNTLSRAIYGLALNRLSEVVNLVGFIMISQSHCV